MIPKKDLIALEIPRLPQRRNETVYRVPCLHYLIRSSVVSTAAGKMLIVAFYERVAAANGFSLPTAVVYQTKDEYINRVTEDGKAVWKKSRTEYALFLSRRNCVCVSIGDERRIRAFLGANSEDAKHDSIESILQAYQTDLIQKRNRAKKDHRHQKITEFMKNVPAIPKGFAPWIDKVPLLASRYTYYRRINKKVAECFCTYCRTDSLQLVTPVHNKAGKCPHCGSKVIYKHVSRVSSWNDDEMVTLLQKAKNGDFVLRYFNASRYHNRNDRTSSESLHEVLRVFFQADGVVTGQYRMGYSSYIDRYDWYPTKYRLNGSNNQIDYEVQFSYYIRVINDYFKTSHLYTRNLQPLLSELNISFDVQMNLRRKKVDVLSYLFRSMRYPFAPSLHRINLSNLQHDILENYYEPPQQHGPLHHCLGITKSQLIAARENNYGLDHLMLFAGIGDNPPAKCVKWFVENKIPVNHITELSRFVSYHKMLVYCEKQLEYIITHHNDIQCSRKSIINNWKDYLQMSKTLGYDMRKKSVLYPKDLLDDHQIVQQLIEIKFDPEMDAMIRDIYPAMDERYTYSEDDFLIRPPASFDEFINEGVKLLHCVCTNAYYVDHCEGTNPILFIRKTAAPDEPFYTMEYSANDERVVQLEGYRHKKPTEEVQAFVDRWYSWMGSVYCLTAA